MTGEGYLEDIIAWWEGKRERDGLYGDVLRYRCLGGRGGLACFACLVCRCSDVR